MIKNIITSAAEITVLPLLDTTYNPAGGPVSVSGTVVMAKRGPVGQVFTVTNDTWEQNLGFPLPRSEGVGFEGVRHVAEAAKNCQAVKVVRVVASDARYPSLTINADGTATTGAHAYGSSVVPGEGAVMTFFIKDGDPSTDRKLAISAISAVKERFTVTLYGKDAANTDTVLESYIVSLSETARDDMGRPAFIESVLDNSNRLGVVVNTGATFAQVKAIAATAFEGGTNGGTPTTQDWIKSWDLLRSEQVVLTNIFAAGNYDEDVLGNCIDIANGRLIQFFFDCPPWKNHSDAIEWLKESGLQSRQAVPLHGAYSASDPYYGGQSVYGFSGSAAAARARANANFSGPVPGVHYTIAGVKRGYIDRRGMKPLFPGDVLDRDALVAARINPVLANDTGIGVYIGDSMALHFEENYSRFEWIASLDNYISHQFISAAAAAKFEPDGLTARILNDIMNDEVLGPLATAGALVAPRNPAVDGTEPYRVRVQQVEIDLWSVEWDYCPCGAARRIAGQPKLIK